MAERFTADLLFIIFVLLIAALLGFIIGYFLKRWLKIPCRECQEKDREIAALRINVTKSEELNASLKTDLDKLTGENAALKLRIGKCEEEMAALKHNIGGPGTIGEKLFQDVQPPLPETEPAAAFDALRAREILGSPVRMDDLEIVEGIGPKISGILMNRGISTWKSLSETSPETIKNILLREGGERYRMHDPDSWPEQARLANEGKWEELKELQDKLLGGRQTT